MEKIDIQAFYNEVVAWINQVNLLAGRYGIQSNEFWTWVARSIGDICEKYNNNPLVVKQMTMMYEWLDEIYTKTNVRG